MIKGGKKIKKTNNGKSKRIPKSVCGVLKNYHCRCPSVVETNNKTEEKNETLRYYFVSKRY